MKRHACTVAAGLVLALVSAGPALATGLPGIGDAQTATQSTTFGDQTVGEQTNDADVTQAQGNGNVNVSPAIAVFGDASTTNEQGSDNTAKADVDQSNTATQTQTSEQEQSLDQSGSGGSCCDGQSQAGEQTVYGGEQTVEKQENDTDVSQYQGNGNVNVSPAIAVFGDASTENSQGNDNYAKADVDQSNTAEQTQSSEQNQSLEQHGSSGSCCGGQSQAGEQKAVFGDQTIGEQTNDADIRQYQGNGNVNVSPAIAVFGDATTKNAQGNDNVAKADVDQSNSARQTQRAEQRQSLEQEGGDCCKPSHECKDSCSSKHDPCKKDRCDSGQSQAGKQKALFGEQTIGEQANTADVTQKQGNGNVNVSPAIALGKPKHGDCRSKCGSEKGGYGKHEPSGGNASTSNSQGNGNVAYADVDQSNHASQSQVARQTQTLVQACKEVIH